VVVDKLLLPCIWLYKGFTTVVKFPFFVAQKIKNSKSKDNNIEKKPKVKKSLTERQKEKLEKRRIKEEKKREKLRQKVLKKAEIRRKKEEKILKEEEAKYIQKEKERIAREERNKQIIEKRKLREKIAKENKENKKNRKTLKQIIVNWYNNLGFVKNKRNELELKRETLLIDFNSEDANRSDKKIRYKYLAKSPSGKLEKGYFAAFSKLDVQSYLLSEGYEVYEIVATKGISSIVIGGNSKISTSNLSFILTQISTYLKAGLSLTDSLKILIEQLKNSSQKATFKKVLYELILGDNFSEALEKAGDAFPKLLINMIKTAEMAGNLVETLDNMAEYYSSLSRTKKQMVSAMIYPIMLLVFSVAVFIFMLVYIIPQFVGIYEGLGAELPWITVMIINISNFLQSYYIYLIVGIVLVVLLFILSYKNIKAFRTGVQYIVMHIPYIKDVIIFNEVTIFTKTFGTLIKHNIFITDSMEILLKVTNNEIFKMLIIDTVTNLAKGDSISTSFKDKWIFPPLAYQMLVTGERTGQLDVMMLKVSEFYEEQHRNRIQQMKVFIEPIMIILIAGIVGVILLAVVIPMFDMYKSLT